ncbi:hypothetical protein [Pseudoclavibacter helvolus]|uniref:Uncharacterized protein n=1 Tax=Pseudoclavibacter helvolus TaxID=255205 RepID=A0A7W4YE46_9MICO|nr:hypothetical protein [Pseudoclavibacter helvolus]MBB2956807.1 hypothetical protein [Pseudoclavibacter helvolus]
MPEQEAIAPSVDDLAEFILNGREEWEIETGPDTSLIGEDDAGGLCGPSDREGLWEPYDPTVPRHVAAAHRSRETGLLVVLELGGDDA